METVLFIVGSYYPKFSAVGKCQYYLAEEFVRKGYNVQVIALASEKDSPKEEYFNRQCIHRINVSSTNKRTLVIKKVVKRLSFDLLDRELVKKYFEKIRQLEIVPSLIIPTCLPFETIYAAFLYKENNCKCKVLPCLYDKFADSMVLYKWKLEKSIKYRFNRKLESKVFNACDGLLYVPSWKEYLMNEHNKYIFKSVCIEHPLIAPRVSDSIYEYESIETKHDQISILYAGMLVRGYVDANYFIKLVSKFKNLSKYKLVFYAQGNALDDLNSKDNGMTIESEGWISYDVLLSKMKAVSILLSIAERNGKQISSKIFEYMSMGKPIIHVYYVENDINLNYLKNYPLAICIKAEKNDLEKNAYNLEKWINQNLNKHLEFHEVENMLPSLTPAFICNQIINLYTNR